MVQVRCCVVRCLGTDKRMFAFFVLSLSRPKMKKNEGLCGFRFRNLVGAHCCATRFEVWGVPAVSKKSLMEGAAAGRWPSLKGRPRKRIAWRGKSANKTSAVDLAISKSVIRHRSSPFMCWTQRRILDLFFSRTPPSNKSRPFPCLAHTRSSVCVCCLAWCRRRGQGLAYFETKTFVM